jgi:hypothetical protein
VKKDYVKWTKEEVSLLKEIYPKCDSLSSITPLFKGKTEVHLRSKVNNLKIKKIKKPRMLSEFELEDKLTCLSCEIEFSPFSNEAFLIKRRNTTEEIVSLDCRECNRKKKVAQYFRLKYGIIMDELKLYDTFDLFQWYRWTISEKTPNGETLDSLPYSLQTYENIAAITRYAVNEIIGLKTKEEILSLTVKKMNEYKIAFSKNKNIGNSPIKLIRMAFPELVFTETEMDFITRGYWNIYENFLDSVCFYYSRNQDILNSYGLDYMFSSTCLEENGSKIFSMRKIYYVEKSWSDILSDAGIEGNLDMKKYSADGERFDSNQEKTVYEFLKSCKDIDVQNNRLGKSDVKVFRDDEYSCAYIPDFILKIENKKPVIVEYFGMYKENSNQEILINYKNKTKRKVNFFNSLDDHIFIELYENDLKNNFLGTKQKLLLQGIST